MKIDEVKIGQEYAYRSWNSSRVLVIAIVKKESRKYSFSAARTQRFVRVKFLDNKDLADREVPARELQRLWSEHVERSKKMKADQDERDHKRSLAKKAADELREALSEIGITLGDYALRGSGGEVALTLKPEESDRLVVALSSVKVS